MNNIKKAFYIALIGISIVGLFIGGLSYYLSTSTVQRQIAEQFNALLQRYDYPPDRITIGTTRWAGVKAPLSIEISGISIYRNDYELSVKQLKLGISFKSLLTLSPALKQITIGEGLLHHNTRVIAQLDGSLSIVGLSIAYKLHQLACNLKDIAPLSPELSALEKINLPIILRSNGFYDGNQGINGKLDISVKQGSIILPPYYLHEVPISQGTIQAKLKPQKIELTQLRLDCDTLAIDASGSLDSESIFAAVKNSQPINLIVKGQLSQMAVDKIQTYWPEKLAQKARHWITTNLSKGYVSKATLEMGGQLTLAAAPRLEIDNLGGNIEAHDVNVAYLSDLPQVTQTSGHCTYSKSNFIISAQGVCNGMQIEEAHLDISELDQEDQYMDIDLKVKGKLETALDLIARKPLQLPQKLHIDYTLFTGIASTQLKLTFPLETNLPIDQVQAAAHAQVENAELASDVLQPFAKTPLTKGQFDLHVTNDKLTLTGTGLVADHPAKISASENFRTNQSQLRIQAEDQPTDPYLGKFDLKYHNRSLSLEADLSKVEHAISLLRFLKEKDQPGTLNIHAHWTNDNFLAINDLDIILGDAHIQGSGLVKSRDTTNFFLKTVKFGPLNGRLLVSSTSDKIKIGGAIQSLDLDPIIQELSEETENPYNVSVSADLRINNLRLGNKLNFGKVETSLTWENGKLSSLAIDSLTPDLLKLHLAPPKNNRQYVSLSCQNAGDIIDYFSPNNDFEGGKLTFVGDLQETNQKFSINGELDLRQVTAIKAPLLAQILSVSSLDGIVRTLSGQGIYFDHILGKIRWGDNELELDDIHASGSSLAINFNGTIGTKTQAYDLKGELYPLNSINLFMANIPVIGSILSGGKNRGIFSTAFTVKGTRDNHNISVNPLSTITPQGMKELRKKSATPEAAESPQIEALPNEPTS